MSKRKREFIISDNVTGVTETFQNTLVFKRCILQELQAGVGSPIAVMETYREPREIPCQRGEPRDVLHSVDGELPSAARSCSPQQ